MLSPISKRGKNKGKKRGEKKEKRGAPGHFHPKRYRAKPKATKKILKRGDNKDSLKNTSVRKSRPCFRNFMLR